MNKYYELRIRVLNLKELKAKDSYEKVCNFVNYSFENNNTLSLLHSRRGLKHYCLSGLYPVEKDMAYEKNKVYMFSIRSFDEKLLKDISGAIKDIRNEDFISIDGSIRMFKNIKIIRHIDNITPAISVMKDSGFFIKDKDNMEELKISLANNISRRYNELNNVDIRFKFEDILKSISFRSDYAVMLNYKGFKVAGYKVRLEFYNNKLSQEIANICLAEGIGEKNCVLAAGFCKPYFKEEE